MTKLKPKVLARCRRAYNRRLSWSREERATMAATLKRLMRAGVL